jgi:hypothetical protein
MIFTFTFGIGLWFFVSHFFYMEGNDLLKISKKVNLV